MAANDVYQVNVFFDFQFNRANTYTFFAQEVTPPASVSPEDDLIEHFENDVIPGINDLMVNDVNFNCIEAKKILEDNKQQPTFSLPRSKSVLIPGDDAVNPGLPGQCSLLIQTIHDINDNNPQERGRDFWTGFADNAAPDGIWTQATADSITGTLNTHLIQTFTAAGGGVFTWGNYSKKLEAARKAQSAADFLAAPIQPFKSIAVMRPVKQVKTQRRRESDNPCDKYYASVP